MKMLHCGMNMMRQKSMAATMTSLRRSGARLFRMTTKLLTTVTTAVTAKAKPAKAPPKDAKKPKAKQHSPAGKTAFSPNPGALVMNIHVPPNARPGAPLVVLLHGCGQAADTFATDTGWRDLANKAGVILLMPGQTEANNRQGCFNWFRPGDTGRDLGEAGSIASMVKAAVKARGCDPQRVFVTGLSAGAAMTACLLAAYPDLFAAGAVVAGLPAGSATSMVGAMTRMSGHGADLPAADWMARARALAPIGYAGSWPRLSIWHGEADQVVAPVNSQQLAVQWTQLQGIDAAPSTRRPRPGMVCESWSRPGEGPCVENWVVSGMGHVYPTTKDSGVSAAAEIAQFWGITA